MMRGRRVGCAIVTLAVAMTGCTLMIPERPSPPAVHDFGPPRAAPHSGAPGWSGVAVRAPDWLQDPRLRYRLLYRQPTRIQFYAFDRWVAPPPELLAQSLAAVAGHTGCRVKIELQTFEQIFERPDQARVRIEFLAQAVQPAGEAERSLAERRFALSRPSASPDAAGAVAAFSNLIDDVISQLARWLVEAPEANLCTSTPGREAFAIRPR